MDIRKSLQRAVACGLLFGLAATPLATLAQGGSGLGARWPSLPDVSRAAAFHAYRWDQSGVTYIQINGADGAPLMALATAAGQVMILPIGGAPVRVVQPSTPQAPAQGAIVYTDGSVEVSQDDGGFAIRNAPAAAEAPCSDPVECSKPSAVRLMQSQQTPVTTLQAQDVCNDPVECSKP